MASLRPRLKRLLFHLNNQTGLPSIAQNLQGRLNALTPPDELASRLLTAHNML